MLSLLSKLGVYFAFRIMPPHFRSWYFVPKWSLEQTSKQQRAVATSVPGRRTTPILIFSFDLSLIIVWPCTDWLTNWLVVVFRRSQKRLSQENSNLEFAAKLFLCYIILYSISVFFKLGRIFCLWSFLIISSQMYKGIFATIELN